MEQKKKEEISARVAKSLEDIYTALDSLSDDGVTLHYGLALSRDEKGDPSFKEFGHLPPQKPNKEKGGEGSLAYSPLVLVDEQEGSLKMTVILPGVPRERISLLVEPKDVQLDLDIDGNGSNTRVKLPARIEPSSALCVLSNGILYITFTKMKKMAKVKKKEVTLGPSEITEDSASLDYFEKELEEKVRLSDDYLQKLIRTQNDFVNFRKRTQKEKDNYIDAAKEDLILALLPVVDNFERALKSSKTSSDPNAYIVGIEMIKKQIFEIFKNEGLEPIPTQGVSFDPNIHDALLSEETSDFRDGEILDEIERGYIFKGKVLRTSKVKVAKQIIQKK